MNEENLRLPRGMHDILPEDELYWRFIENIAKGESESLGYLRITPPIIDNEKLFSRSIGEETDIVSKEMFRVKRLTEEGNDEEKNGYVLRPEATAQIARSYITNGMHTLTQPVKLYYLREAMFRYERPQAGRSRQFYQFGAEIFGSSDPITDAMLILLVWQILKKLQVTENIVIDINSIGCKNCRPNIKKQIVNYYKNVEQNICQDCQNRLKKNPLRLLDCKNDECQPYLSEAPQIVDNICPDCKNNFSQLLESLDDLNIPYNLAPQLVRGLDYYTRTVFEVRDEKDDKRQSVLIGGGRYDDLIEELGGHPTPAIGFSLGYERMVEKIKERGIGLPSIPGPEILIVQLGDKAEKKSLPLLAQLLESNFRAISIPGKESLRSQLRIADKYKIPIALIIGQREAYDNSAILRDMREGTQETIDLKKVNEVLNRYLRQG